ncbi:Ig-like domain-containing protein [Comamonas thiooxydans]|uniref:Ig-like domain-containing protein n=1 Tax=Comamonas thiooxydans TaxID=363952 RepID=UPI00070F4A3B|nr:Ig-like domain-containing protein [Comamonas thiooxydans]
MEAVYKSGGKVASTEQGLVLDKPSAVILKVAPEQIAKSTRVGNDLVLTLVDGKQIYVNGFFAPYAEEGRNDLVLEDQQGVLWWGQYGGAWEGFEFTEIESNESVAAWLPWLVGLGLGGLAVSSGGSGGGGKNVNNPPEPVDPNKGLSPGAPGHVPGQEFSNGGYKVTVREDQPFNGKVVGKDSDGDSLTYGLGTPPAHGTVTIDKDTGEYTYTPNKDWSGPGSDSFEVIVDDGKGGKTTTTVTVNVTPEQDVTDDTATTGYDKPVTIDVLGNDEFEGKSPTITQVDGKAITEGGAAVVVDHGEVKLVNGQLVFTPKAGFVGDAKFSYTAQTDGGTPEQANVTVTVAANQLPEPTDPNIDPNNPQVPGQTFTPGPNGGYKITVDEDGKFDGKVTGTDKDGDELTYELGTPPAHGTVTVDKETGKYTYTPDPDWDGPDEFTVILKDGKGGETPVKVVVEFTSEEDAIDDSATTGYEKSVTIDVLGNDEFEGKSPTITQVDGKAITEGGAAVVVDHGEVKLVNGRLVFTPEAGFNGNAEFSYTAKTDKGSEETAKVTVIVNSLPEFDDTGLPPGTALTADGYVIGYDEGRTSTDVLGKVHAVDPDSSDAVKYSIDPASNPNGWFQIDENTGEIRLTEEGVKSLANDFEDEDGRNSHQITVVATDSAGGKTSIQVALNEQDVNDTAPVLEIAPGDKVLHVAEEALSGGIKDDPNSTTTATGKISFTDADKTPDINTFSVEMKGPADGSITSGGVAVTWSWDASSSTLTGMAGAKEVMTIKVDPVALVNGKYEAGYTVTLKGPVDHPKVQGENSLDLDFKAIVHDGVNDSNEIGFTVEVKDDVPALSDNAELAINLAKLQTNLMIVLDLSGSMAWDTKGATLTGGAANPLSRLSIAKKALEELINKYGQYGDVAVKLVTFQGSTANAYATWMSAATAIAKINALTATGGTPHATALKTLMESANGFADNVGKLVGGQNVSYFITDGAPSTGQEVYGKPIQGQWESFLATNHINSVVVGFSEGIVAGDKNALDAMAYNGTATPPVDTDGFFAKTATELTDTLQNNIQLPRQEGSLRGELDTTEGFGADDGFVNVLNVDGKTYTYLPGQTLQVTGGAVAGVDYTYDVVKHVITVKTAAGGSLTVEFDTAKFIYVGKALSSYWDKFGYTIQDMDGDTASTVKDVKVVYDGVEPAPKPAPFASPMMAMSLDLEHLDALHADADDPAALPALHDVLQPQSELGEAGGNIAGLGSADAPAAPAAPVAAPQDLALYMPAPLPEEELHQPVHV